MRDCCRIVHEPGRTEWTCPHCRAVARFGAPLTVGNVVFCACDGVNAIEVVQQSLHPDHADLVVPDEPVVTMIQQNTGNVLYLHDQ